MSPVGPARGPLALLTQLPIAVNAARDIDDVLRVIARHVMEALAYEDCVIYVRDGTSTLVQRAAWGPKCPDGLTIVSPLILNFGEGVVGTAAATGKTQTVVDTRTDSRYVPDVAGGLSELAVPIIYGGKVLGVVDSEHPDTGFYSTADAELITTIAAIAAAQLHAALSTDRLRVKIDELHRAHGDLARLARTDSLTGLANRLCFEDRLAELVGTNTRFAICALDLDGFKTINDVLGHHEGDEVLRVVARILHDTLGTARTLVARVGGDEFTALTPVPGPAFGERCLETVGHAAAKLNTRYDDLSLSMSAGVAFGASAAVWHNADDALYAAKACGGNRLRHFNPADAHIASRSRRRAAATEQARQHATSRRR